ncbi:hypothetical protein SNOG_03843 [Parastagonospora nodorum SN15]|uniref:Uncharacterized protein n=1 Tax=Phaeosphaeria nodorum (strain SN15 / ATCC MYA-4574 / FGSC 10173) TaxID=321614 RepID=Q0UWM1_PHANO|nr:hypothetical protein SNOG_03843 [Parastagonospora nodorum SN15]EAT89048.2 hypothetical protein SNOG_03843 [Parastagonospora nodorum SN15]
MAEFELDYSYLSEETGQNFENGTYYASGAPWVEDDEVEHLVQFDAEPTGDSDDTSESEEEQQSESSDNNEEDDGEDGEQDDDEDDEEDNDDDYEDVNESEEEAEDEDAEKASGNDRSAENAATTNININYINYESTNHNNYVHDESYYDDSTNQSAAYYDLSETNLSYAPVSANLDYAPSTSYLAYTPSFQGIDRAPASRANYSLPSSTPNHTGRTDNAGNANPAVNAPRSIGTAPTQQKSSFFGLRKPKPNPVAPKTNTAYPPANSYHALPTYQAFNPATKAAGPIKPKVNKQAAKGQALPPAPGQMQIGPLAYKNLLENIFRVPVKFDKKGIAVYTIGVSNTLKGAAKMKKKGMMLYRSFGQVKVWSKSGKM